MPLLLVLMLLAAEPAAPVEAAAPPPRPTAAHLAFAGGIVASSVAAGAVVFVTYTTWFQNAGRPEPLVLASSLAVAWGLKVALSYFLLPDLYRAGGGAPDIAATRESMWRWVRWPAVAAVVSVATFFLGAALERDRYGRGQLLMLIGFSGLAASHTVFDILSLFGSSKGYRQ